MELDHDSSSVSSSSSNLHSPSHYSSSAASEPPEFQISHKRRTGRKKFRETRHPMYRGVRQRGNGGKWVCEVRVPNMKSRVWVGTFSTAEMAARGHDVAMLALKGKAAVLNFDDSAWVLPRAKSASARDIQVAAAEAVKVLKAHAMALPMSPSCSSTGTKNAVEAALVESQSGCNMFLDEEAMFNLPGLLHSMAEGLLMTPPFLVQQNELGWGGVDSHLECLSLWSD